MNHRTSILCRRNLRAYAAAFISYLMLAGQVAPLALAASASRAPLPGRASEAGPATNVSAARRAPAPFFAAPVITATKVDSWDDTATPDGKAEPGQVVTYTVTITNSGDADATNVKFSDVGDPNTSLVSGSVQTQPIARADTYTAFGNVRISTPGAANLLANDFDPDTAGSTGLTITTLAGDNTAPFAGTSANGGNVSATTGDGSFEYNPAPGFTGTDTFTYTVTDGNGKTDTATATVTVGPTLIWFINNASAAGGDGRITSPFNSIAEYNASAPTKDPNDIVFIYQGSGPYAGSLTLTSGMKLIGQGFTLQNETGTPPAGSDALPPMTANPVINSSAGNTVTLNQNNTVRGLTLNNAAGIDIVGNGFGTLTVSNVTLSGTGRPLSLTTGTVAATFDSINATSASGGQGILLSAVGGSLTSGGTSITGATTQGILVTGSTVSANFGNTTISGGTDGVSLQNNSSGTRTFGTLTVSGNSAVGFLHGAGGGTTNVTGATSITNPGGAGIDIQSSNAAVSFAATTVGKNNAGTAVNLTNNGTSATSFASLAITASSGAGLVTSAGGNLTVTTGSIVTTGTGVAASLTNTALNLTFTTVSSNGGANGVIISGGSGSFTSGTTTLQNNAGLGLSMSSSAVAANFGNTGVSSSAGDAVDLASNTGAITFADLDMTPDPGLRGLDAQNNTGAITVTSGDVTTSGGGTASAVFIDGPAGRTPINITFTSVTTAGVGSGSASVSLADVSGTKFQVTGTTQINTRSGRGVFVDNSTATNIQFGTTNIPNASNAGGNAFHVEDSSSAVTVATATIDNSNTTSTQADGDSNGIPESDGDGDAIFLKNNAGGSFALNGGTLSNCGNDCVDVRDSQNFVLSGVTINTPGIDSSGGGAGNGGNGILATNLTGTNALTGVTITNVNAAGRSGMDYINTVSTAATLTVTGGTFSNSTTGSAFFIISARNTSNLTSTFGGATAALGNNFTGLFGSAINHAAGDQDSSTATANITIRNNTFQNAANNGLNTVSARNIGTGHAVVDIRNNTFNNVARIPSSNAGVITVNGDGTQPGNTLAVTVSNNTISNIGAGDLSCGAAGNCTSLRAIQVFIDDNTNVTGTMHIDGNTVTNVRRAGLWLDIGRGASGSNVSAVVNGNTFGTAAAPVGLAGQAGVSIFSRCFAPGGVFTACGKTDNVAFSNNTVVNNSSSGANETTVLARSEDDTNFQLTATGNNITNQGALAEWTSRSAFPIGAGNTQCLDMNGNTLNAGAGQIIVDEDSGTILNVEQASAAALAAANGIPAGNVTVAGSPQFGVACATPPTGPAVFNPNAPAIMVGVVVGALNPADTEPADKSAFGGGVTDRPFLSLPRGTRATAAAAAVAAKTAAPRKTAEASAQADGSLATGRKGATTTGQGAGKTATPRVPGRNDNPGPPNGTGVGISNFNIGTLPAGDSVTITFQVTIDNPYSGGPNVENQGTVTADGGISVLTDDPAVGGANDKTLTPVNSIKIFAQNGKAAEPATGTAPLLFTVTLSAPATGTVSVNYATADGGPTPAEGGASCGGTVDYESTNGTLIFAAGQQVKTVSVNVCADTAAGESEETLLLNLSGATGGNIQVAQATGTITQGTAAGTFVISELRTSGPGGTNDDFVEFYNNTDTPLTVTAGDASAGYGVFARGTDCNAAPVLIGTIPNGTVIPARGHYLMVGTAYSLTAYAAGNLTMTSDLGNDANVAVFTTADAANVSTSTRLDAVGFGANAGGGVCDLLREGNNLPPVSGSTTEHSFFRKQCDFVSGAGCTVPGNPKDTNDTAADFLFADTLGSTIAGVPQQLGAPGPENMASPIRRDDSGVSAVLLDTTKPSSAVPNRSRDFASGTNASFGTLSIRRRVTNNTASPVTRLRFRIVELTTFPVNTPGSADLRALSSTLINVSVVNDPATCPGGVTPCTVPVQGTTLETPPNQPEGGAYNSTLAAGTITTGTPLAPGASVNVQFLLGIETPGKFRFYIVVEALP